MRELQLDCLAIGGDQISADQHLAAQETHRDQARDPVHGRHHAHLVHEELAHELDITQLNVGIEQLFDLNKMDYGKVHDAAEGPSYKHKNKICFAATAEFVRFVQFV